jgi:hypothetical protein
MIIEHLVMLINIKNGQDIVAAINDISASARISKGQGYQGFLRKRAGSSFG